MTKLHSSWTGELREGIMLILRLGLVLVSLLAGSAKCSHLPNITFTLGDLGPIIGVEKRTKSYEGAEYSNRPMYTFRAIPYAHPVIDQQRFQQSKILIQE